MRKRILGRSDIAVAPWCFGGNVFGWTADRDTSFALLDAFVGAGFDFIDTADVYSRWAPGHVGGESETVIGEWLAARGGRDKLVIATKVGMGQPDRAGRLDAAHINASIDASLKRLRTDYVDLYQSHADDPDTPIAETLEAYAGLVKAGKVRIIGASNFTAARLRASLDISAAHRLPRYETLQPEYNLSDRAGFERDLQQFCRAEQLGVIPYFSLAAGFLTGKYRSEADFGKSPRGSGMAKHLNPRGLAILAALDTVSAEHATSLAAVALAWLMAQPSIAAPIASATSLDQFRDIVGAATLRLTADDMAALDAASATPPQASVTA
ncbi:aldo/keto reductase [Lichenibacterium ramalinae]|uniref:Aldo/keto reductase n=1 Tax=Lichenibacterium ramalinae TaxID=2316527 RepID=A0A4Q2RDT3_9HYPH|nr:aldo/keto reductase [Lichenibacterium ramalinae]RYB05067.1 aldo/keto reductase [Lichenibacterium ramalinae]